MSNQTSILLVEDDENDVFFLQTAFCAAHIQNPLHVARDGQEAMDYLAGVGDFADRATYPLPGLVILDLKMPRKTGMHVLKWMRQQPDLQALPVIVFSSSGQKDDIEKAYRLGANSYVVKPASVERRTEFARFLKGYWLDFNEPPMARLPRPASN